jgi:hypothetical protein
MRILFFKLIWSPASYIVNHSIYLFRIWILGLSDKEARNRSAHLPFVDFFSRMVKGPGQPLEKIRPYTGKPNPDLKLMTGPITDDNRTVNGLWIGNQLSKIELLTISSFINNGHEFHLWIYEPIRTSLPEGVIIEDANEIIDTSKIFRYKYTNDYGHGKGSVSGFSDIFRYKLLFEKGGWWTDMDMTCLHHLNIGSPYFFRSHHDLFLVGNIMKAPKGSELMNLCYKEANETIDENNTDWHKPIEILNKYVHKLQLEQYVFCGYSNEDNWDEVKLYAKGKVPIPDKYMLLHWMNEEWRSRKIDKNDLRLSSALGKEMIRHNILQAPKSKLELLKNELRHVLYLPMTKNPNNK